MFLSDIAGLLVSRCAIINQKSINILPMLESILDIVSAIIETLGHVDIALKCKESNFNIFRAFISRCSIKSFTNNDGSARTQSCMAKAVPYHIFSTSFSLYIYTCLIFKSKKYLLDIVFSCLTHAHSLCNGHTSPIKIQTRSYFMPCNRATLLTNHRRSLNATVYLVIIYVYIYLTNILYEYFLDWTSMVYIEICCAHYCYPNSLDKRLVIRDILWNYLA